MIDRAIYEVIIASILFTYTMLVVYATKLAYKLFRKKFTHDVAVYFNRKLIHIFAGGLVALLVPIFFTSPLIPATIAFILALLNYITHVRGKLLDWYQVKENVYEVNFCLSWGVFLLIGWVVLNPTLAIVPLLFMSFGDAATGLVRNIIYKRRVKAWIGNLAMFIVCSAIGLYYLGYLGIVIALIPSVLEKFEYKYLDDNVIICASTFLCLLFAKYLL